MKIGKYFLVIFLILFLYLVTWPIPIDPVAWTPLSAPDLKGEYAINDYLASSNIIHVNGSIGPEDVDIDKNGLLYCGFLDG